MNEQTFNPAVIEMLGADITALRDTTLTVVENVTWSVQPGEFWVIAGQQHSGKSDLLMNAAGLMMPARGACRLFGQDTKDFGEAQVAERLRVGLVFTDGKLFNQLTVAENVALPLRYHKDVTDAEAARAVEGLLELLELTPLAGAAPGNITAGWRQRTALARALILQPELLLLDNPNSGLMLRNRLWLVNFLDQLNRGHKFFNDRPITIVATTDDPQMWQHPRRKFAALHEGTFSTLGIWDKEVFSRHEALKDWITVQSENTI